MRAGRGRALVLVILVLALAGVIGVARVRAARAPLVFAFDGHSPNAVALSRGAGWLALADEHAGSIAVDVRAIATGELVASLGPAGIDEPCQALAFDGTGEHVAAVWNGKAAVWRVPR